MDRSDGPKRAYADLIGRLLTPKAGGVSEAAVEKLPDPDLFRDALLLSQAGSWSASDLDATDALLVALVMKLKFARTGRG